MVVYGLKGKYKIRDKMLDMIDWKGDEMILDIGVGKGLLMNGAAKRLNAGRSIGIDIWRPEDLSGIISGCNSSKRVSESTDKGHWQSAPVLADGDDREWKKPLIYHDSREECSYALTNDSSNLYICLKTGSNTLAAKIFESGLALWLNNNGRKEETMCIIYPVAATEKMSADFIPGQIPDLEKMKVEALGRARNYRLLGFGNKLDGLYDLTNHPALGLSIGIGINKQKELVYELSISLSLLYNGISSPVAEKPANFAVGFVIKGLTMPEMPPGMGGGPGGLQGQPPGGGFDGGPDMQEMQKMSRETKIWKVQPLAVR